MKHRAEIETLVERFLEGRTTSSEERELYAWFASADIPEEWHDLKAMFAWYSEGMPETLIEETSSQPALNQDTTTAHTPAPRHATPRRRTIWLSGAAIGTGIAAIVATLLWFTPARPTFDIYEGSYIIEAGVRCDNSDYIRADIEALLERADNIEQKADMLLALAD